jgi:hypothetical protein
LPPDRRRAGAGEEGVGMLFIKSKADTSPIADIGCFTLEPIKKGAIIGILAHDVEVMQESEYNAAQAAGEMIIIQTAIRWAGELFLFCDSMSDEDYINHSFDPNMLYHCGVLFARRNIKAGEELTANYQYFLAYRDHMRFPDIATGRLVDGLPAKKALQQSAEELLELFKTTPLKTPKASQYKGPSRPAAKTPRSGAKRGR